MMPRHPLLQLMRMDTPIGIWLLLFPACWGVLLAGSTSAVLLLAMLLGAAVMRAAGCIINDLTDRDLDGAVARTRLRPLVTGAVSLRQAYGLLAALLAIALALALCLPRNVLLFSLMALPLIAAYPWMKRITWWPQLFLGVTFNFGAIIGWAATGTPLQWALLPLYLAGICWTLGYDTIYAMQDQDDDAQIGIKSTARRLGRHLPHAVSACYTATISLLLLAGAMANNGPVFLIGITGAALHFRWQLKQLQRPDSVALAGALFRSNQWVGLMVTLAMLADQLLFSH